MGAQDGSGRVDGAEAAPTDRGAENVELYLNSGG